MVLLFVMVKFIVILATALLAMELPMVFATKSFFTMAFATKSFFTMAFATKSFFTMIWVIIEIINAKMIFIKFTIRLVIV